MGSLAMTLVAASLRAASALAQVEPAPDAGADAPDQADPIDAAHRPRPDAPPPAPPTPDPVVTPEPPLETDHRPACVVVGGGVAATLDGQRHEGPQSRCISIPAGPHRISAERLETGEALWNEEVTLAPGERAAVTPTGLRRTP